MKTFLENIFITLYTGYTRNFHLSNIFFIKFNAWSLPDTHKRRSSLPGNKKSLQAPIEPASFLPHKAIVAGFNTLLLRHRVPGY